MYIDSERLKNENAIVLLSGGQDSVTCLFWAIRTFKKTYALSFDYSQKHKKEINIAKKICKKFNIDHKIIKLPFLKEITISNLFEGKDNITESHPLHPKVPSSFVPYRNALFLIIAAAWASSVEVKHLVIGASETDYAGYADCRDQFIKAMQVALNLATDFESLSIIIHTPLMWLTKAEEFKLAEELGCLDIVINESLSCYNGNETKNYFGKGCGKCPACLKRKAGFDTYLEKYK